MANDLDPLFQSAADQYGLPVGFLKAIAQQETGTNPNSRDSYQGAQGLMQMLPQTAAAMGAQNPRDPAQAIPAAARYLREGLDATGSLSGAAAYYHGGPDRKQWGPKTSNYVQSVGSIFNRMPQPQGVEPRTVSIEEALGDTGKAPPAMASDDFDKRWGIGAAATSAADQKSGDDFDKRWGIAADGPKATDGTKSSGDLQGVALGTGLVNGIPIAGPYILSGLEKTGAAANAVLNNSRYSDELAAIEKRAADAQAQHGAASTVGGIGGAVAGYTVGGIPALGAKALGMTGASIAGRMGLGAASNALIGGADAAVRDQNPIAGAVMGAVGGAGAPVIGGALGAGVNKLTGAVQNIMPTGIEGVSRPAANLINKAIAADDPAAVRAALARGGDLAMLADAGPSVTGLTGALALKPGEGKSIVENALTGRAAGSNDRIGNQLTQSLGPEIDPMIASNALKAQRSAVNSQYSAIHSGAPPVDPADVVAAIDARLENATGSQRTALQNLKSELIKTPQKLDEAGNVVQEQVLHSSSERLHNLRKDIDMLISGKAPGLGVERGAISSKQGALQDVRSALDDVLKTQVPGMAETDAASAALAARMQGIERGYGEVLGAAGPHPETFAATRSAQPAEVNAAENIGIRGRVGRMFGTGTQRDAVTLNKLLAGGEDGYSTANLKTAFGEQPVNSLLDTLGRERMFNNTTNEVVQNSATARRTAAGKMLDEATPGTSSLSSATLTGVGLQSAKKWIADPLISMILRTSSEPMKAEMAHVLTAQGQTRDEIVSKLLALHGRQNSVSAWGGALSNAANTTGNRLTLGLTSPSARANYQ